MAVTPKIKRPKGREEEEEEEDVISSSNSKRHLSPSIAPAPPPSVHAIIHVEIADVIKDINLPKYTENSLDSLTSVLPYPLPRPSPSLPHWVVARVCFVWKPLFSQRHEKFVRHAPLWWMAHPLHARKVSKSDDDMPGSNIHSCAGRKERRAEGNGTGAVFTQARKNATRPRRQKAFVVR